jgi:hypothetical protein
LLWSRKPRNFAGLVNVQISSSPVVADLNGDGQPEILVGYAGEMAVFDHNGNQLTETAGTILPGIPTLWLGRSIVNNSAAVADIDNNGTLDIVTAGSYCDNFGNCDNRGHVRVWSASVLGLLNPSPIGRASQSKLAWPMFRREPTHQAFAVIHASLGPISPALLSILVNVGTSKPQIINLSVSNTSPIAANYVMSYSQHLSGPASGTIGPYARISIPITVNPTGLGSGHYALQAVLRADTGVDNGSQTLNIDLVVANLRNIFLPHVRR